jgi:hypothetical protein
VKSRKITRPRFVDNRRSVVYRTFRIGPHRRDQRLVVCIPLGEPGIIAIAVWLTMAGLLARFSFCGSVPIRLEPAVSTGKRRRPRCAAQPHGLASGAGSSGGVRLLRSCSDCDDAELETKIVAQITCIRPETSVATPPEEAAAPKADTDEPLTAAARQGPATWAAAAAREWVSAATQQEPA